VVPSSGFGANAADPDTIESMIASPSARAVASTAAATIAGRAARTTTVHMTRQRFTPSAAAPSAHERGTARSASTMIAIMIGVIITVRIRTARVTFAPESWTTKITDSFRPRESRWFPIHGAITRIPISP
jgi:hypothetical protein